MREREKKSAERFPVPLAMQVVFLRIWVNSSISSGISFHVPSSGSVLVNVT